MKFKKIELNISIITKIIVLIFSLLIGVTLFISNKNSNLFQSIFVDREEGSTLADIDTKTFELDTLLEQYIDKVMLYSSDALQNAGITNLNFENENDFVAIAIHRQNDFPQELVIESKRNKESFNNGFIQSTLEELEKYQSQIYAGKVLILNVSSEKYGAKMAVGLPIVHDEFKQVSAIAWAIIDSQTMQWIFRKTDQRSIYVIDSVGHILLHNDQAKVLQVEDVSKTPVVLDAAESSIRLKQKYYQSSSMIEKVLTSFSKSQFEILLVSEVSLSVISGPAKLMRQNSNFLLGIVLSISLIVVFYFSQRITNPIEKLSLMTEQIAEGNFYVNASEQIRSSDEVGTLAKAFDRMTDGLIERDKMKNILNKFHGSIIAQEILNSDVMRRGQRYDVTVFFSDIRGFTDFSESHSPEEVVTMLNDYFEVMVKIINKHGGIVDKFIGDAIMAIWGAPMKGEFDATNAISAALEMRLALVEFNDKRISEMKSPIKIGIGLHSGVVVAGTVGSNERMEYTVIGDSVNTAARIEASTKAFGTDLLVSDATIKKVESENNLDIKFIFNKAGDAAVQGKTQALSLMKVLGYFDKNGQPNLIQTPYSSYTAQADKKVKIANS